VTQSVFGCVAATAFGCWIWLRWFGPNSQRPSQSHCPDIAILRYAQVIPSSRFIWKHTAVLITVYVHWLPSQP